MTQLGFVFRQAAKVVARRTAAHTNGTCCAITDVCDKLDPTFDLGVKAKEYFRRLYGPRISESRHARAYWMFDFGEDYYLRTTKSEVRRRRILALLLAAEIADSEEAA